MEQLKKYNAPEILNWLHWNVVYMESFEKDNDFSVEWEMIVERTSIWNNLIMKGLYHLEIKHKEVSMFCQEIRLRVVDILQWSNDDILLITEWISSERVSKAVSWYHMLYIKVMNWLDPEEEAFLRKSRYKVVLNENEKRRIAELWEKREAFILKKRMDMQSMLNLSDWNSWNIELF